MFSRLHEIVRRLTRLLASRWDSIQAGVTKGNNLSFVMDSFFFMYGVNSKPCAKTRIRYKDLTNIHLTSVKEIPEEI